MRRWFLTYDEEEKFEGGVPPQLNTENTRNDNCLSALEKKCKRALCSARDTTK